MHFKRIHLVFILIGIAVSCGPQGAAEASAALAINSAFSDSASVDKLRNYVSALSQRLLDPLQAKALFGPSYTQAQADAVQLAAAELFADFQALQTTGELSSYLTGNQLFPQIEKRLSAWIDAIYPPGANIASDGETPEYLVPNFGDALNVLKDSTTPAGQGACGNSMARRVINLNGRLIHVYNANAELKAALICNQ